MYYNFKYMSVGVKLDFCKEKNRLDLSISDIFYFSMLLIKTFPTKDCLFCRREIPEAVSWRYIAKDCSLNVSKVQ